MIQFCCVTKFAQSEFTTIPQNSNTNDASMLDIKERKLVQKTKKTVSWNQHQKRRIENLENEHADKSSSDKRMKAEIVAENNVAAKEEAEAHVFELREETVMF